MWPPGDWRVAGLRLFRAIVFVGVILMMHRAPPPPDPAVAPDVPIGVLKRFFPTAAGLAGRTGEMGAHLVEDASGDELGFVVATSPEADGIIGYSGPNDLLVAFGVNGRVLGVEILSSGDTEEHVAQVAADGEFLDGFKGKTWEQLQSMRRLEGVSGATLTSLAMAEGVIQRVAGSAPSLRFPEPLELADAQLIFPEAEELLPDGEVLGEGGALLGRLLRSSPYSDKLIGYAGPTDVLVGVTGDDETIVGIAIGQTYDTEKYVGWVKEEAGFIEMFDGKPLAELASFDLEANGVEGVSGATMSSMTVARSLVDLADARSDEAADAPRGQFLYSYKENYTHLGAGGIGTVLVVAFGLVMAFSRLRGVRKLRIAFQLVLVVYLGLMNGDLISQALLVGWAQNGTAWRFAPGLLLLVAAALLVPLFGNKQVYCHQLCPHGAAQQLVKNWLPKRWRLRIPPRVAIVLKTIPLLLLVLVIVVGVRQLAFNLVSIEPFYAYLFRIAGWATISIAIIGLLASLFVPLAYCRYGCPTGAVLNFLWGGGKPGKFSRRDQLAIGCLVLAITLRFTA